MNEDIIVKRYANSNAIPGRNDLFIDNWGNDTETMKDYSLKRKNRVVEYTDKWTTGGIESYILNIVRLINVSDIEVRILVAQKDTDLYDQELSQYGVTVETLLNCSYKNPIKRVLHTQKKIRKFFLDNTIDTLHLHLCQGVALRYAKTAKKAGIGNVIVHSHNSDFGDGNRIIKRIGHEIGKRIYNKYTDQRLACSDLAARWLFSRKDVARGRIKYVKYIVDVERFIYSKSKRDQLRIKYGIDSQAIVLLNIGRFNYQKNHVFLVDVFNRIRLLRDDVFLVLIGTGELENEILSRISRLGISDGVLHIKGTRKIDDYMCMSDVLLMPSLFEGNPIVGVEAQANGLYCIFSNRITDYVKILNSSNMVSIDKGEKPWVDLVIKEKVNDDEEYRRNCNYSVRKRGYNAELQIEELIDIYIG